MRVDLSTETANILLEVEHSLNMIPNKMFINKQGNKTCTYDLASKLRQFLKEQYTCSNKKNSKRVQNS